MSPLHDERELPEQLESRPRAGGPSSTVRSIEFADDVIDEFFGKTAADIDGYATAFAESLVDTWFGLGDAYKLANNPTALIGKLNSDGDSAVVSFSVGGDVSSGLLAGMTDFGEGLLVRQIGDGTAERPAVYEVTAAGTSFTGLRLGSSKLPKVLKDIGYVQADLSTYDSLTFRFSSKADATRAVASMIRLRIGENLSEFAGLSTALAGGLGDGDLYKAAFNKISSVVSSLTGQELGLEFATVTSDLDDVLVRAGDEKGEPGPWIHPDDFDFLDQHFYGTTDRVGLRALGAAETTNLAPIMRLLGFEGRISGEIGLSRNVALPQGEPGDADYSPGQVSYTLNFIGDATSRTKNNVNFKRSGSDNKGGASVYSIDYAGHGDGGRGVTLTWELAPDEFDGREVIEDPLMRMLTDPESENAAPKWATIDTTTRDSTEDASSLISSKRPDKETETLRITIEHPFERRELLGELALAPDLDEALAGLEGDDAKGIDAVRSKGQIAASGVEIQPGLGLPIGGGGYAYINVGVDDLGDVEHEILMGEGFPGLDENPPRFLENPAGRRINPRLLHDGYDFVEVRKGDTLSDIAKREKVDLQAVISLNREHVPDPDRIRPGDIIFLPEFEIASAEETAPHSGKPDTDTT